MLVSGFLAVAPFHEPPAADSLTSIMIRQYQLIHQLTELR